VGVAGCAVVWFADPTIPGGVLPVCPTKALLGIDCPFCGGLRAAYALLHGDLGGALRYNALALVLLVVGGWVAATWVRGTRTGRPGLHRAHLHRLLPALYLLAAVWFVVRLLPLGVPHV
jgi:hypothetical protein